MNIRDLKYLVAVAHYEHFSKAAKHCYVSQPTLSAQLKKLEDNLGVPLFERDNKHVRVTPMGALLVKQAQRILQEVDTLKNFAKHAQDPFADPFRLGVFPTAGPYLLPYIFPIIKNQLPDLQLIIHEDKTDHLLKGLQEHTLDAVIQAIPAPIEQLQVIPLYDEYLYVGVPLTHPLAKRKTLQLENIKKENLLLLPEGHCLREHTLNACPFAKNQRGKNSLVHDFQATSLETLAQLVLMEAGIAIFPALAVPALRTINTGIKFIPLPKNLNRRLALLHRKQTARKSLCEQIACLIQLAVKELPYLAL